MFILFLHWSTEVESSKPMQLFGDNTAEFYKQHFGVCKAAMQIEMFWLWILFMTKYSTWESNRIPISLCFSGFSNCLFSFRMEGLFSTHKAPVLPIWKISRAPNSQSRFSNWTTKTITHGKNKLIKHVKGRKWHMIELNGFSSSLTPRDLRCVKQRTPWQISVLQDFPQHKHSRSPSLFPSTRWKWAWPDFW